MNYQTVAIFAVAGIASILVGVNILPFKEAHALPLIIKHTGFVNIVSDFLDY